MQWWAEILLSMPSRLELVNELLRLHDEFGRTPTKAMIAGQGTFDPEQYQDEFDSWEEALRTVGFDPDARKTDRYTVLSDLSQSQQDKLQQLLDSNENDQFFRGQLLVELHRLAIELQKTPSTQDVEKYSDYSDSTYYRHFESWSAAVKEAELTPNRGGKPIPDEKLLAELRRLAEEWGEPLHSQEMRDHGRYSVPTYCSHFGSWKEACERVDVETGEQVA